MHILKACISRMVGNINWSVFKNASMAICLDLLEAEAAIV